MESFPQIISVSSQFPSEYIAQSNLTEVLSEKWQHTEIKSNLIAKFHRSSLVNSRYIALPRDKVSESTSFKERNDIYINVGLDITEKAIKALLEQEQIPAKEISQIIFTSVTGLAVPSMDARLMNRIAFSPHMKRVPLFGLGCVAGAAGIARAADYLCGHPNDLLILVALELCSLTFQDDDISLANVVSSGLFGDGCAVVLLAGARRAETLKNCAPKIIDTCSFFFPNTERVMGFDINNNGFKIVLSSDVPKIAQEKLPPLVDRILQKHHLHRNDVAAWIAHPGGPKVMEALTNGLNLSPDALSLSYESLAEVGNLSSASVLMVLQKTIAKRSFKKGDYAVMLAMGPAFCAEVVLLKW